MSELFQALHKPAFKLLFVSLFKVIATKFNILRAITEQMVSNDQYRARYCYCCAFLTSTARNATKLRTKIIIF